MIPYYSESIEEKNSETQKIANKVKEYTQGIGIDLGCGAMKIPGSIGVDIRYGDQVDVIVNVQYDNAFNRVEDFVFEKTGMRSVDYIYTSHLIEDFEKYERVKIMARWLMMLRSGGYFIVYVPQKDAYKGVNLAHKDEFEKGDLEWLFAILNVELISIEYENEKDKNKYSILGIGKKN